MPQPQPTEQEEEMKHEESYQEGLSHCNEVEADSDVENILECVSAGVDEEGLELPSHVKIGSIHLVQLDSEELWGLAK